MGMRGPSRLQEKTKNGQANGVFSQKLEFFVLGAFGYHAHIALAA